MGQSELLAFGARMMAVHRLTALSIIAFVTACSEPDTAYTHTRRVGSAAAA
jgi:hypothetical protein